MSSTKNNFQHGDIVWYCTNAHPYQIIVVDDKRVDLFHFSDKTVCGYTNSGLGAFNTSNWRLVTPGEMSRFDVTPPIPIPNQITNNYELY